MMGSIFAGTEESPERNLKLKVNFIKDIEEWDQLEQCRLVQPTGISKEISKDKSKHVPEGVEGRVEYKGKVSKIIYQLKGGLRSSMGYIGASDLNQIKNAKFIKITKAGF